MPGSHLELVICQWEKWRSIYLQGFTLAAKTHTRSIVFQKVINALEKREQSRLGRQGWEWLKQIFLKT